MNNNRFTQQVSPPGQGGYGGAMRNRMGRGIGSFGQMMGGYGGQDGMPFNVSGMGGYGGFGGFNPMMGGYGGFGGFNPMMGGYGGFGGFNPMMAMGLGNLGGYGGMGGYGRYGGFNPMMGYGNQFGGYQQQNVADDARAFQNRMTDGGVDLNRLSPSQFSPQNTMGYGNNFAQQQQQQMMQQMAAQQNPNAPPPGMMANPNYNPATAMQHDVVMPGTPEYLARQRFIRNPSQSEPPLVTSPLLGGGNYQQLPVGPAEPAQAAQGIPSRGSLWMALQGLGGY